MGFFKDRKSDSADSTAVASSLFHALSDMKHMSGDLHEQYAGAIAQAGTVDSTALMAVAQRVNHLTSAGVQCSATVNAVRETGPSSVPTCVSLEFDLTVTDGPGAPHDIVVRQELMGTIATYQVGQTITILVDPNNPNDAMIGAKVPGGSDVRIMKLEQLAAMNKSGVLTDERFAAMKAAILAEE